MSYKVLTPLRAACHNGEWFSSALTAVLRGQSDRVGSLRLNYGITGTHQLLALLCKREQVTHSLVPDWFDFLLPKIAPVSLIMVNNT